MVTEHRLPIIDRWFAAVALTSESERAAAVDFGSQNVVAVATAHSACEIVLGLIADEAATEPGNVPDPALGSVKFGDAILAAAGVLAKQGRSELMPHPLRRELKTLNDVRNMALHRGTAVAYETAVQAPTTARTMLAILPHVLPEAVELGPGCGLASAVADLQESPSIARGLRSADEQLSAGDHERAADWLSQVWRYATSRADLPRMTSIDWMKVKLDRSHKNFLVDAEGWITQVATGLDSRSRTRLLRILGSLSAATGPNGEPHTAFRDRSITREDVVWAADAVANVVYRLWSAGRLDLSEWERDPPD